MTYPSIRIEGQILSADLIDAIEQGNKHSQDARDFGFETRTSVKNEIADAWAAARSFWTIYQNKLAKLDETSAATTETRNLWLSPLLSQLGYQPELATAAEVNGKTYAISHRDHSRDGLPIHVMGWGDEMDKRRVGVNRLSPHATLQEYLNVTEHLYGLVSNGRQLRLLRDSSRLIKLTYLEFDLQRMFEEELYADFAILFRLLHASRLPQDQASVSSSIIERYHLDALESGSRIREGLRDAVEDAMHGIANGLLSQEKNTSLQELVENEKLTAQELHHALLRLIYRLLFLMVIEERNLVHPASVPLQKRRIYFDHYSIQRLRRLADRPHLCDRRKTDLWHGLSRTLSLFEESGKGKPLGIEPLGSELFRTEGISLLLNRTLDNGTLLKALRALSLFHDGDQSRRVNYSALDVEELGSIYESLLELQPTFQGCAFHYKKLAGSERKTTGSYYTPAPLVQELIKSALVPVLEDNLKAAITQSEKEQALLATRICDPACGSGAFLIAASHHLAFRLAQIRAGEDAHAPGVQRKALRDVVSHCIFGVDINPLSVELCKVSLWLLAVEPGKPLSFLDHHIRCGNSLLGTSPALIAKGIPQAAYKPLLGDTKESCDYMKGLNKDALDGQKQLFGDDSEPWKRLGNMPAIAAQLETTDDDTIEARQKKEATYQKLIAGAGYENSRLLADAWSAAFVWPKDSLDYGDALTTEHLIKIESNPHSLSPTLKSRIKEISDQYAFFHWHLEFPAVFRIPGKDEQAEFSESGLTGGFDVLLGNPPWEKIQSEEKQWFATKEPEIATLSGPARKKAIAELESTNPTVFREWMAQKRHDASLAAFLKISGRYPLTARGKFNLFGVFAELNKVLTSPNGRCGSILPTGIATDDTTKLFFQGIVNESRVVSLFDFENRKPIFPQVDRRFKFCLLTICGTSQRIAHFKFCFFAHDTTDIYLNEKKFILSPRDIKNLNPNSLTCPIFRFQKDAVLTLRIHKSVPILLLDKDAPPSQWPITLRRMFNLTDDAHLFIEEPVPGTPPLYEAKYIHHFDHRWNSDILEKKSPDSPTKSRYHIEPEHIREKTTGLTKREWFVGWRDITRTTDERTVITSHIPFSGIGNTIYLFYSDESSPIQLSCLSGILNSFVVDYCARQKVGGTHLNHSYMKQLPVLFPEKIDEECPFQSGSSSSEWAFLRILELVYTAWDLNHFANEASCKTPPFSRSEKRRFQLRAELDALFFHLYLPCDNQGNWVKAHKDDGAVRNETEEEFAVLKSNFPKPRDAVAYIMDTFPIVRRKDIARTEEKDESGNITRNGTYITKDRILEIYDAMLEARRKGKDWTSPLDPPPASYRMAHLPRLPKGDRNPQPSTESYLIGVIYSFICQTRFEASLRTFCRLYDLLQEPKNDQKEWQSILGDDATQWIDTHNDALNSKEFIPILTRLQDHQWVVFDSTKGILSLTEQFKIPESLDWVHYDVSAALARITREDNVATIQLDSLPAIEGIFKTGTQG